MNLYIDCEFNSYRGALISMALVSEDGCEFYEVLPQARATNVPWVEQHVIPVLAKDAVGLRTFQNRLSRYLNQFPTIHIISDYPSDIQHFMWVLETDPGERLDTPPLTCEVKRDLSSGKSAVPHNALEDARAIAKMATGSPK